MSDKDKKEVSKIYSSLSSKRKKAVTIAVSEDGRFGFNDTTSHTSEDRIRKVMQICEHLAQADCGIVANEGQLVKFHPLPRQLKYVKELDLELVPFISDKSRERLKHYEKSGYLQQEGISTVIALGQRGEFGYSTDIPDVEVATEIALDYCNLYSRKTQCFVYSVNNDVVFNPSTEIISDKKGN